MIGIDKNEVAEYILKDERGKERPTIFLIGNIPNREKSRLFMGAITGKGEVNFDKIKDNAVEIVKIGLKGIINIEMKKGEFSDISKIDDDVIDMIPFEFMVEIMSEIINHNFMTKAEEKN